MGRPVKISFCLITLNEEANLRRCLDSCADLADEIIILDSGSSDATATIAKDFGAHFIHQDWLGYVGQKNKVLRLANHDWVFSLDADEELSPELREDIRRLKTITTPSELSGYSLPRCVLYDGRWIRHGDWYPDRLVRLFRCDRARFAGGKVHERLLLDGPIERLHSDLYHHSFKDDADHWTRCQHYARLWAETQHEHGKTAGPLSPWTHAAFRWFRGYILKRGFLDGAQGWRIARYCAREVALKYRLLRAMGKPARSRNL